MANEVLPREIATTYEVDLSGPPGGPAGRNVFVFLDGTWNEERDERGEAIRSNVRLLYDGLASDDDGQIGRYFRGVGNKQDNGPFQRFWCGLTGRDERKIRESAYATIVKEYRPGDNLFILGFSRGAACARRLAAHLQQEGIPERITIRSSRYSNRLTNQVENCFVSYEKAGRTIPARIRFLGCWDTVGAFVLPLRFPEYPRLNRLAAFCSNLGQRLRGDVPFNNLTVAAIVDRAVHCVAIDETRNAFLPVLMNAEPRIEEVWFPGVHADVGGGYARAGLARLSREFMVRRLEAALQAEGLRPVKWSAEFLAARDQPPDDGETFDFHFHGLSRGFSLYGKSVRQIRVRSGDQADHGSRPRIHGSVMQLWQSDRVFAETDDGKVRWRVLYSPYNVRELNRLKAGLGLAPEEWPFEWVEKPEKG